MKPTRENIFEYLLKLYRDNDLYGLCFAGVLFLLLLPYSIQIEFMQNDDWVYYGMVERFMNLNFTLDPLSAPTFYTQGILGALFSRIFGIEYLPVLTLIVSAAVFFVLYKILLEHFNLSRFSAVSVSMLVFFNPFFMYSVWGFMTENYFLLFLLLAVMFYLKFLNSGKNIDAVVYGIFLFLALNIRQVAIAFPLSALMYSLIKKDKKLILLNLLILSVLTVYYILIFPSTAEMSEKSLQFHHLTDIPYIYALIFGSFVLLTALMIPLILPVPGKFDLKKVLIFLGLAGGLYFLLNYLFDPSKLAWAEFPFFENTFERKGFYPRGVLGTKYHFKYMYDLYYNWYIVAKIVLSLFLAGLVMRIRKTPGLWGIFIMVYLGVMVLAETFYDRYLVALLPFVVFFALGINGFKTLNKLLLLPFVLFLSFYCYQFSMDFILVNKYIWNKSEELVVSYDKEPRRIQGTTAWNLKNLNERRNYTFDFSYDSPIVNENYREHYSIEEIKRIDFQGSLWVNPYVYLYKKIN